MLQLKRLVPPGSADVFAKLEYLNPGGSVKDRAAIGIIPVSYTHLTLPTNREV